MRRRCLLILLLPALFSLCHFAQARSELEQPQTPEQILALADHYMQIHQVDAALPLFESILERYPQTGQAPWAGLGVAQCYFHQNQNQLSILHCESLVQKYPDTVLAAWASTLCGDNYVRLGNDAKALEILCKTCTDYDSFADRAPIDAARIKIGEIYLRYMSNKNAEGQTAQLLAGFHEDSSSIPWALATAAGAWARLGVMPAALDNLRALQSKFPNSKREIAWATTRIGEAYANVRAGKPCSVAERADLISLLRNVRKLAPQDSYLVSQAELTLAKYLRSCEKDNTQATSVLKDLLQAYPNLEFDAEARYVYGQSLMAIKEIDRAAEQLQIVAYQKTGSGFSTPALYAYGRCLMEMGKPAEARVAFEDIAANRGESDWKLLAEPKIATCLAMEKRYAEAAQAMSNAATKARLHGVTADVAPAPDTRSSAEDLALKLEEYAQVYAELAAEQEKDAQR